MFVLSIDEGQHIKALDSSLQNIPTYNLSGIGVLESLTFDFMTLYM